MDLNQLNEFNFTIALKR